MKLVRHESGFWVRENEQSDISIIHEVYHKDSYKLREFGGTLDVVVDAGAHIGSFSKLAIEWGAQKVVAIEVCPENIEALHANVGDRAHVMQGALTYDKEVALLNSVWDGCECTGGSCVDPVERVAGFAPTNQYRPDFRPIALIHIEHILRRYAIDRISLLKMDIESSEYSVLSGMNDSELSKIDAIVCEWHRSRSDFFRLIAERFNGDWEVRILRDSWTPGVMQIIRR